MAHGRTTLLLYEYGVVVNLIWTVQSGFQPLLNASRVPEAKVYSIIILIRVEGIPFIIRTVKENGT